MYTHQMLKRSKYIVRALKEYDPPRTREIHSISLPSCSGETFEYYKGCVETGDARVNMPLVAVAVTRTGEEDDFEDPDVEEDEQQDDAARTGGDTNMVDEQNDQPYQQDEEQPEEDESINLTINRYCNGYFFALAMEDCQTANLILDALVAYTVEVGTLLNAYHVKHIHARRAEAPRLHDFALDLWALYALVPWAAEVKLAEPGFWAEVEGRRAKIERENPGVSVEEVLGDGFIAEEVGRYHCFSELHPGPGQ